MVSSGSDAATPSSPRDRVCLSRAVSGGRCCLPARGVSRAQPPRRAPSPPLFPVGPIVRAAAATVAVSWAAAVAWGVAARVSRGAPAAPLLAACLSPLAGAYLAVCLLAYSLQTRLLFHPVGAIGAPAPPGVEEVAFETEDGERLRAYVWPPPRRPAGGSCWRRARGGGGGSTWLVLLHGNAGNRATRLRWMGAVRARLGCGVAIPDYRGYGGSSGAPSEPGLMADARAVLRWLRGAAGGGDRAGPLRLRDADRVFLVGESMGCSLAVYLAAEAHRTARGDPSAGAAGALAVGRAMLGCPADAGPHVAGLVLHSPFTSAADVGKARYPFLPRAIVTHRFPSDEWQRGLPDVLPKMVLHSDADATVPYALGRRLYGLLRGARCFVRMRGLGHNDVTWWADAAQASGTLGAYLAALGDFAADPGRFAPPEGADRLLLGPSDPPEAAPGEGAPG